MWAILWEMVKNYCGMRVVKLKDKRKQILEPMVITGKYKDVILY